jgi:hypothetical protein
MRYVFILILGVFPMIGFSQQDGTKTMDFNKIDYRLLDSLIIVEINKFRDTLGHIHMNYSRVLSDNITSPRCEILRREQHVYHPKGRENLFTTKVQTDLIKESLKTYKFKGGDDVNDGFEICLFKNQNYKLVTYGDYASSIVQLWCTSTDHAMVVRDAFGEQSVNDYPEIVMSGVSTKYGMWGGRNGFYAVLNLVRVIDFE